MSLIEARGVSHRYGRRVALAAVSLDADAGDIIAVVGPHGSGKTVLLRLLAGAESPTRGAVLIDGHAAGTRAARLVTGYATDPPLPPTELTGWEWLHYVASQHARTASHRQVMVRYAASLGGITGFAHRRIGRYPRDAAQRLAVAAAAMAGRQVVLLDEPLAGLDPIVARDLQDALGGLARAGRAIVIASHDLATIERLATRVLVLWEGRLVADVQTATLLGERVAEIALSGGALAHTAPLLGRFRGAVRTGGGVAIPLRDGLTVEGVLHDCRELRIAVAGSRVRYRVLEDLFLAAAAGESGGGAPSAA